MKAIISISLLLALLFFSCLKNPQVEIVEQQAELISQKYAPDKRVALFALDTIIPGNPMIIKGETNNAAAKDEFILLLKSKNIGFADSFNVLPSAELHGRHFGIVNISVCNIRSKRGHSQELATQALLGTPLRVWKEDNGFFLVQTPDDYLGWLDRGGFTLVDSAGYNIWLKEDKVVVTEDYVFALAQPAEGSPKVSDMLDGNIIKGKKSSAKFSMVEFPDGRQGYVLSAALAPYNDWLHSRNPEVNNILQTAHELIGRPYLWGGTSGKGMDCSGFTKTVFYLNGILLPRDASQQVHTGTEIETDSTLKNLIPGDFLFFGRKANADQKERITHVGIYLGHGKMIHAAGMVEIISLKRGDSDFSESRLLSFVRAKRIVGETGRNGILALKDSPYY